MTAEGSKFWQLEYQNKPMTFTVYSINAFLQVS